MIEKWGITLYGDKEEGHFVTGKSRLCQSKFEQSLGKKNDSWVLHVVQDYIFYETIKTLAEICKMKNAINFSGIGLFSAGLFSAGPKKNSNYSHKSYSLYLGYQD